MKELIVEDSRKWFDLSKLAPRKDGGFGLTSIRERAEKTKGKIRFNSSPGKGTQIHLTVPVWRWFI